MSRLIDISPDRYRPHSLHQDDRVWAQTNCYTDLWIEVFAFAGIGPRPGIGMCLLIAVRRDSVDVPQAQGRGHLRAVRNRSRRDERLAGNR